MTDPVWTVREYLKTDSATIAAWWGERCTHSFPFGMLPPLGVIAELDGEPVAACWLYMACNVGVCFLEHAIAKPGLLMGEAREAFRLLVGALERAAKANDYGVMECHTLPAIARILRGFGFLEDPRPKKSVVKLLNQNG